MAAWLETVFSLTHDVRKAKAIEAFQDDNYKDTGREPRW